MQLADISSILIDDDFNHMTPAGNLKNIHELESLQINYDKLFKFFF